MGIVYCTPAKSQSQAVPGSTVGREKRVKNAGLKLRCDANAAVRDSDASTVLPGANFDQQVTAPYRRIGCSQGFERVLD